MKNLRLASIQKQNIRVAFRKIFKSSLDVKQKQDMKVQKL